MFHSSCSSSSGGGLMMDRRWKTNIEIAPNCPRCASTNTKFCYYNNYSLSQPRYFCKSCRRYWTKGGSLRNVPFGGGCRKSRRSSNSKSAIKSSSSYQQYYHNSNNNSPIGRISGHDKGLSTTRSSTTTTCDDHDHIDLAAVFSKFLTQDSFNYSHDAVVPEFPSGQVQYPGEVMMSSSNLIAEAAQDEQPFYSTEKAQVEVMEGVADYQQEVQEQQERLINDVPQVLGSDDHGDHLMSNYGLQDLLSNAFDDHQDFSWSDSTATSLSSFSELMNNPGILYEPATVVVNSDDHSMFLPTPPLQGNWSSFDIPSYGASIIN